MYYNYWLELNYSQTEHVFKVPMKQKRTILVLLWNITVFIMIYGCTSVLC